MNRILNKCTWYFAAMHCHLLLTLMVQKCGCITLETEWLLNDPVCDITLTSAKARRGEEKIDCID